MNLDSIIPPAYEIVLKFQCEDSSYIHDWISDVMQVFLQWYVDTIEV